MPTAFVGPNATRASLAEGIEYLTLIYQKLVSIISTVTGKNEQEIYDNTKVDTYFDAESACRFGLATDIFGKSI